MSDHHEFIHQIKQQLEDWDYQLDRLEHRVDGLGEELREKAKQTLEDINKQRLELKHKMAELTDQSENAVEDLKEGIELAWDGLKTAYSAARKEFEERP